MGGRRPDDAGRYISMSGGYTDDLSVAPQYQGCGVAKALITGAAQLYAGQGVVRMSLDVRAFNVPAIKLYQSLGFVLASGNSYPPWYDWHGGYKMHCDSAVIAARL